MTTRQADARAITVTPATAARWDDVVATFGTKGDPSWCWCQYFATTGASYEKSAAANKDALHGQVTARPSTTRPAGLLAYRGREAVGWVQLGPIAALPRVTGKARRTAALVSPSGDGAQPENLWRVACFVVPPKQRRPSVARALLDGAVAYARDRGADALEAHPVDTGGKRVPGADLFHGVLSTVVAAGFEVIGRTATSRPIVRLDLTVPQASRPQAR